MMWESNVSLDRLRQGPSPGNVVDWVARNDAFEAITASMTVSATLRGQDGGTPITGVHVTRGFFDVHRRQPMLGRTFDAAEFVGAASITSRLASSGESVEDPVTLVTTVGVLLVVVVAASWLPARRAARIDPGHALRM